MRSVGQIRSDQNGACVGAAPDPGEPGRLTRFPSAGIPVDGFEAPPGEAIPAAPGIAEAAGMVD